MKNAKMINGKEIAGEASNPLSAFRMTNMVKFNPMQQNLKRLQQNLKAFTNTLKDLRRS